MKYDENKKLSLDEIRKVELQLLLEFTAFCDKHNLRYVLEGGTLIGAVRHKGFIPWDDDVDVSMPFPDFLKFVELYKAENKNSYLQLLYGREDPYGFHFGKFVDKRTIVKSYFREDKRLYPVWLDVFPMYSIDNDDKYAQMKVNQVLKYYKKTKPYLSLDYPKACQKIFHFLFNDYMRKYYMRKIDNILFEHEYGSTNRIRCAPVVCQKLIPAKNDHFDNPIKLDFEGYEFYAPKDYDEYLTRIYGNYMELPPENERITHKIEAYWVE